MTDVAYANRVLGSVYNDLGYLVDTGIISEADFDVITAKIPCRYKPNINGGQLAITSSSSTTDNNGGRRNTGVASLASQFQNTTITPSPIQSQPLSQIPISSPVSTITNDEPRKVPQPPSRDSGFAPPAYAIAQAEALYDYAGGDEVDLQLQVGDKIAILEYVNDDWWRGECRGREGVFPSSYVRKVASGAGLKGQLGYGQQQQQQTMAIGYGSGAAYPPALYNPPPGQMMMQQQRPMPVEVAQAPAGKTKLNSIGGKLGNAALFGAGATIGSNIVNSIF